MLSIEPITESYVCGLVGIDQAYIQGKVTVPPKHIWSLELRFLGKITVSYAHDLIIRQETFCFLELKEVLLSQERITSPIEIPFCFDLTDCHFYNQPSSQMNSHILPSSLCIDNFDHSATLEYQLVADCYESNFFRSKSQVVKKVCITSFDPFLIPKMLFPESKQWISMQYPLEYAISVKQNCVGPGDLLTFCYKLAIDPIAVMEGIRIMRIRFLLLEKSYLGHIVSQVNPDSTRVVRQSSALTEVIRWEQSESLPRSSEDVYELTEFKSERKNASPSGGDGSYLEGLQSFEIPFTINPSTFKYESGSFSTTSRPFIEVRHSVQITVEFNYYQTMTFECPIYLSSFCKNQIEFLLNECPHMVPCLEYEKIMQGDLWVPLYEE